MAKVTFVTSICDEFTEGVEAVDIEAATVFQLVRALDRRFPGIGPFIEMRASVAVDGAVIQDWSGRLTGESEVLLFPRLAGGSGGKERTASSAGRPRR